MSFPQYPEYKDSGVEWLGEVPTHWDILQLRGVASREPYSFTDGDWVESPFITDEGVRLIQTGNIGVGHYREQGYRYISEETFYRLKCTELFPGDVLICRLADPVGRACLAPDLGSRMITSVDVCILKTKVEVSAKFLVYFLSSKQYLFFMSSVSRGGTRERVSRSFLGGVRISLPSTDEQSVIASFLDHETARIDALVAEQQRLIELLKEKRQAVISHAVTKGLNPDVPMKDSGVEWLGAVPAHWGVTKLSYITNRIGSGKTPSGGATTYVTSGVPFIRSQNVHDQGLRLNDIVYIDGATDREMAWSRVKPLDVLINITGASIGRACQVPSEFGRANVNQHVCVIRLDKAEEVADWVAWTMKATSTKEQVKVSQTGAAREGLNFQQLAGFYLCMPSLKERRTISAFLKQETARIDALVKEGESVINLLQERRSALISAGVTGKIDVRGWQPQPGSSSPTETTATEPA